MINFNDVLAKGADDIERPALPPVGTYQFRITKVPEQTTSASEEWDMLNFNVVAVAPMDNVDMADFPGEVTNIRLRKTFMFNKNDEVAFNGTMFNLKTFLTSHVKCWEDGMSLGEALNASSGQEFLGDVKWREDKRDGMEGEYQAEIGRTAPLD